MRFRPHVADAYKTNRFLTKMESFSAQSRFLGQKCVLDPKGRFLRPKCDFCAQKRHNLPWAQNASVDNAFSGIPKPIFTFSILDPHFLLFRKKVILSAKSIVVRKKVFSRLGAPFGAIFALLRKCSSRQWFLWSFELHFANFLRRWISFPVFSRQKSILASEIGFGAKKRFWSPKTHF